MYDSLILPHSFESSVLLYLFIFFLFVFHFGYFSLTYLQVQILFSAVPSLLMSPQKGILHCCWHHVIFNSSISITAEVVQLFM